MGFHQERVEKSIERELSSILLMEAKNHLLKYVSITKVVVTSDLSIATVWYTIMGNDAEKQATGIALEQAKGFLKSELAKRIDVRRIPDLKLKYDESLAYGNKISNILDNLKEQK